MRGHNRSYEDYALIKGKPYLGTWLGFSCILHESSDLSNEDESLNTAKHLFQRRVKEFEKSHPSLESRNFKLIVRPCYSDLPPFRISVAAKWMAWGRAYVVKRIFKKGVRRYKKKLINGQRKYVRVDRLVKNK